MVAITPEVFAATGIGTIVLGSLYALMALGFTLIYSTVRILNFAHGSFFMFGAMLVWFVSAAEAPASYAGAYLLSPLNAPLGLGFVVAIGAMFVAGMAIQRGINARLLRMRSWELNTLVALFAIAMIVQSGTIVTLGPFSRDFTPIATGLLTFGRLNISNAELVRFAVAVSVIISIQFFLKKSRHGLATRAVSQDREVASVCSVKIGNIYVLVFGVGAALAAIAGILLSNLVFIAPEGGWLPLIRAFLIVIFGGIGSVPGTIIAAFLLAFIEQYTALIFGFAWAFPVAFTVMILVLILRPRGLFGLKE
ncbi:MAG: branched-chain amino acid ABC transporter permease [Candidatus Bathyarchaeia archaeon]